MRKMANCQLLVLDEWLLEVMEGRFKEASAIFCTQFQQKDWHARLGGGIHADAIMDRIVHNASWVEMGEMNMRAKYGRGVARP